VRFELLGVDAQTGVRAGVLHTSHGSFETPAFMPVGTRATVKSLTPRQVRATGAGCVLANTYHLVLQPGAEMVRRLGGLHAMMGWDGAVLTDSGGFQVFSLGETREVTDAGVTFRSHLDGGLVTLTPENVIQAQEAFGADIIMPLDECVAGSAVRAAAERALERTQRWWSRSEAARRRPEQALFALVQGATFADLRQQAARAAAALDAPGFAIGGFSVGEARDVTERLLAMTLAELPADRPRYLMGVGTPRDLAAYTRLGVDMFDCVLPTRLGRTGAVWADAEGSRVDLRRRATLAMSGPIQANCPCEACTGWSVGALAALYQAQEPLAYRLASVHNLTLLGRILAEARERALCQVWRAGNARSRSLSFTLATEDACLETT